MNIFHSQQIGKSHLKHNLPCQDAYAISECPFGFFAVAVADGLGSCKHSDIGSRIAVDTFTQIVSSAFPYSADKDLILSVMFVAASAALGKIVEAAASDGNPPTDYETTLECCLFQPETGTGYILHAGDGGIIALKKDGQLISTSTQYHKGMESNSVIPLSFGYKTWEFQTLHDIQSVLITTDGLLEFLQPFILNRFTDNKHYPAAILPLLDIRCHADSAEMQSYIDRIVKQTVENDEIFTKISQLISSQDCDETAINSDIRSMETMCAQQFLETVSDDKTLVVMSASEQPTCIYPTKWFEEPDWEALAQHQHHEIYQMNEDSDDI